LAEGVNANIRIDLDTSDAIVSLRALQSQISEFNKSVIRSNAAAVAAQQSMISTLTAQIGATKQFTTSMVNVETSVSKLGRAIDKNKLTLGEYFRYGVASSRTFGRVFRTEHNAIMELAADRVKRLQTQYIAMGEAQNGVTRAMAVRPMNLFNADAAIGIQRQQLFNKLLHDGSTSLINWGKNTQWAGRQLMVGFTVPLTIFGGIAGQVFMDLERQIVNFRRVYGDATTPAEETEGMIDQIKELGSEFTKYGIAVKDTITLASQAAAAGAQGGNLLAQTEQATRLATLGMMEQQQALDATIALQSAFQMSSTELAESIDFLNAVENQTVVSLQDVSEAIPKVAPVIQGLGGDVQDLAIFLAAMREGGVSAAEGANALKSGLASLISPTKNARAQLNKVGIDIDTILSTNKGDLRGIVMEFGAALSTLSKFQRQQTLAKVFGKYQFARLGALFENVARQGSQAQRVVDLTGQSVEQLAQLAEKELGAISDSVGVKFTGAVERLKLAIAPIGEAFLRVATPIIEFATKMIEKFNELSPTAKNVAIVLATGLGVVVPTVTMLIGLFANFIGQAVKGIATFTNFFSRMRSGGDALNYLSQEQLDALAAASALEGKTDSLTTSLNVQRSAVENLTRAYATYVSSARAAATNLPQGFRTRRVRTPGFNRGGIVPGTGNKDTVPAMLTPGESVITKEATEKFGPVLQAMNSGKIPGFVDGVVDLGGGQKVSLDVLRGSSLASIQQLFDSIPEDAIEIRQQFSQMLRDISTSQKENGEQLRLTAQKLKDILRESGSPELARLAGSSARYSRLSGLPAVSAQLEQERGVSGAREMRVATGSAQAAAEAMREFGATAGQIADASTVARAHLVEVSNEQKRLNAAWHSNVWEAQSQAENQFSNLVARYDNNRQTYAKYLGLLTDDVADERQKATILDKITRNISLTEEEYQIQKVLLQNMLADVRSGRLLASEVTAAFLPYAAGAVGAAQYRARVGVGYGGRSAAELGAGQAAIQAEMQQAGMAQAQANLQGQRKGFETGSPSEAAARIGDEVPRGTAVGIQRSTPIATRAAAQLSREVSAAAQTSDIRQVLKDRLSVGPIVDAEQAEIRQTIALRKLENKELEKRKQLLVSRGMSPISAGYVAQQQLAAERAAATTPPPVVPTGAAMLPIVPAGGGTGGGGPEGPLGAAGGAADDASEGFDKAEKSASRLSSRLFGLSMGATTVAGSLSMMDNEVGDTAASFLPFLAAIDGLAIGLTLLDGKWGKIGGKLKSFAAPLVAAGGAVTGLVGKITALGAKIPFIGKLGTAFSKIGGAVAKAASAFMRFSGLGKVVSVLARFAAFIGPQGIIAGLIALGVAIVGVWNKFQAFRDAVAEIGASFKELFEAIFGPVDELGSKAAAAGNIFSSIWNGVLNVVGPVFTAIAKVITIVIKAITIVVEVIKNGVPQIIGMFSTLLDNMGPVGEFIRKIGEDISNLFKSIPAVISTAWNGIMDVVGTAINFIIDRANELIRALKALKLLSEDVAEISAFSMADRGAVSGTVGAGVAQGEEQRRRLIASEAARDRAFARRGTAPQPDKEEEEDGGGGGGATKSWFEELLSEISANLKLFGDGVSNATSGVVGQLRSKKIPEQLIAAIGAGPEGLKRAQELLKLDAAQRKKFIGDWIKQTIGQTVSGAIARANQAQQRSAAKVKLADISVDGRKVEKSIVDQILQDENAILTILKGKPKQVEAFIRSLRNASEEIDFQKQALEELDAAMQPVFDNFDRQEALFQQAFGELERQYQPILRANQQAVQLLQEQIDAVQREIDAVQQLNDADEQRIRGLERQKEMLDRQLEALERQNEQDERKIEALRREDELRNRTAEALSRDLDLLSEQEEKIRKEYQDRISALENIARINDQILQSQKDQLGVAQAISSGDIYAATAAAQEMRQNQIQFATEQTRAGMEQGMENAVASLTTPGGLTRAQAEEQLRIIKEQSYQTSLQIRDIEDQIYNRNLQMIPIKDQQRSLDDQIRSIQDVIYDRETSILNIQNSRLTPLNQQLQAAQQLLTENEKALADAKAKVQVDGLTYEQLQNQISAQKESYNVLVASIKTNGEMRKSVDNLRKKWVDVTQQIAAAVRTAKQLSEQAIMGAESEYAAINADAYAGKIGPDEAQARIAAARTALNNSLAGITNQRTASINASLASGTAAISTAGMYAGGMVVRQYAQGGSVLGQGTRDSVNAQLTPGEFVVRKAMVDKYGSPMFNAINQGSFRFPRFSEPRMWAGGTPNFDESTGRYRRRDRDIAQKIIAPMYNTYSVNVNVEGSNSSAEQIANMTITRIKQMQNMQIRGNRG